MTESPAQNITEAELSESTREYFDTLVEQYNALLAQHNATNMKEFVAKNPSTDDLKSMRQLLTEIKQITQNKETSDGKLNKQLQEISDRLQDPNAFDLRPFKNGRALVKSTNPTTNKPAFYYIRADEQRINQETYTKAHDFKEDKALVWDNKKCFFITASGDRLSHDSYDWALSFDSGFAQVKIGDTWHVINSSGDIITPKDTSVQYLNSGFMAVEKPSSKKVILNTKFETLNNEEYETINGFKNGYAIVQRTHGYNMVRTDGTHLSETGYKTINQFVNGFARARIYTDPGSPGEHKSILHEQLNLDDWVFVDKKGKEVGGNYRYAYDFEKNGRACVKTESGFHIINTKGVILTTQGFEHIGKFNEGRATVQMHSNKHNWITKDGKLLNNEQYDRVDDFTNGRAKVQLGNETFFVDIHGNRI